MKSDQASPYRAKIQQTEINEPRPDHAMPAKQQPDDWQPDQTGQDGASAWVWLLLSGVACFIGFSLFEAVAFLNTHFETAPITTLVLGGLMTMFVGSLCWLTANEYRGYRRINTFIAQRSSVLSLRELTDANQVKQQLDILASHFSRASYAFRCYRRFNAVMQPDHDAREVLNLYRHYVTEPVRKKANEVVKKEAMASGSMAFISPNHLIQTLLLLWISVRTIKRVSRVYGLRPATVGNWKLIKILTQNLAAQSVFDLATDELTNQLGGALAAKLVENSAEAVAASALNVRLGNALIKLLDAQDERDVL